MTTTNESGIATTNAAKPSGLGRAFGKVILLGEHAVVYGVPAIALSIERGATARARAVPLASLSINGTEMERGGEVDRALRAVLTRLDAPEMRAEVELQLPHGCGLGASAAIGVAVARAVQSALGRPEEDRAILDAADGWERVFHGNPSGIDAAAALGCGCVQYTRGEAPRPLNPELPLRVAIAVAGPAASTKAMVDQVARLRERRPDVVNKTFDGIQSLVRNAVLCIEDGDRPGLGKLMDYCQMLLSGLMLSTPEIEHACSTARSAGALGAKLTGAGGGGCVVALVEEDPEPILKAWRNEGFEGFAAETAQRIQVTQP